VVILSKGAKVGILSHGYIGKRVEGDRPSRVIWMSFRPCCTVHPMMDDDDVVPPLAMRATARVIGMEEE
jgi:hypothetical protein